MGRRPTRRRSHRTTNGARPPSAVIHDDRDAEYARELRAHLLRSGGSELIEVSSLRGRFGGYRFSSERRRAVQAALVAAGIEAYPSLEELERRDQVRLDVVGPPTAKEHPLRSRLEWHWRVFRTRLLSPAAAVLGAASAVATLIVVFFSGGPDTAPPSPVALTPMNGDLNIAVAGFRAPGRSQDGFALAMDTYSVLKTRVARLDSGLRVQSLGPDKIGLVAGTGPAAQALAAARLARRTNADLVIYGDLFEAGASTRLQPHFYLNARKLPAATELVGDYAYGRAIAVPYAISRSPQARAALRNALIRRADGFAASFVAVGYYLTHDFTKARTYFTRALPLMHGESRSLMLLFLGNIANQRNHYARAASYYDAALKATPHYARAEFGLAEVHYQQARGTCSRRTVDTPGLFRAREEFERVPSYATQRPAIGNDVLAAKVAFGLGQVDLCLSESGGVENWQAVQREFDEVIGHYGTNHPELRDDAAEAYAGLGLRDLAVSSGAKAGYLAARGHYGAAAELSTIPRRRAFFYRMVGFADTRLRDRAGAAEAYRRAAALGATRQKHARSG